MCPLGLEEGLDDKLVAEDAVASLGAGEEFMSTRLAGRLRLREAFVKLEGQLGGVDTSGRGAHTQWQAGGDRREVNAGAQRVAHEAGEEAVALAAGEPGNRRAPGRRRRSRAVEQRHRAAVEVVPQLERCRRRRRVLWVRVSPAAESPGGSDGRVVGSVVPERAELVVRRGPRRRGRGREEAGQAARDVALGARRRRRGRRGRARRRAARARLVLRRRVDDAAPRRAGVHGYRRHGHGRRNPSSLFSTNHHHNQSLLAPISGSKQEKPNPLLQFRS